jgi:hypothetical protein
VLARTRRALPLAVALSLLGASTASAAGSMAVTFDVSKNVNVEGDQAQRHGWMETTVRGHKPLEFVVVKLKPGKDSGYFANNAYKQTVKQLSSWGTLVMAGVTRPGQPHVVTANLTPGWHSIVIRGKDGYVPGGFTAGAVANGEVAPAPGAVVSLRDSAITGPGQLRAGESLGVYNAGRQVRDLRVARLAKGQSVAQANRLLRTRRASEVRWAGAPRTLVGWISPRVDNVIVPRLARGRWLLVSTGADGRAVTRAVTVG